MVSSISYPVLSMDVAGNEAIESAETSSSGEGLFLVDISLNEAILKVVTRFNSLESKVGRRSGGPFLDGSLVLTSTLLMYLRPSTLPRMKY